MKSRFTLLPLTSRIAAMVVCFGLLAPDAAVADCSEDELTAVFILEGISINSKALGGPDTLEGKFKTKVGVPDLQVWNGGDLFRDTESFWNVDTFNCANLDANTPDNHAWWCGAQFAQCDPDDPPEGYGNSWNQRLGWHGTVPDPTEPVTVTVRARMNLDSEPGYDYIRLQYVCPEGVRDVWGLDGFAEGLIVEQTFTLQPEDYTDPFDAVLLRWSFRSDGAWSDEVCIFPSAGAALIDLIEVFFDQGAGPVQIGDTETCEPGTDLQWSAEIDELRLELLDVAQVGTVTNPSIAEMIEAVEAVQPGPGFNYYHQAQAGPFHLFYAEPMDFGGCAIVDGRDGRVVFAGTVVWLGPGSVTLPMESSHSWSFPPGDPAADPTGVEIMPNYNWSEQYGTPNEITDAVVNYLRGSDVLRSFSDCGSYDVVSYIYTPEGIPGMSPDAASQVIIVSGRCGPPWADFVSAAPPVSSDKWLTFVYPNPFNPQLDIRGVLPKSGHIRVSVLDIRGREISVLFDGQHEAGETNWKWNGRDKTGRSLASGVYLIRMETNSRIETRGVTLVR
jgi:hypothetical protein